MHLSTKQNPLLHIVFFACGILPQSIPRGAKTSADNCENGYLTAPNYQPEVSQPQTHLKTTLGSQLSLSYFVSTHSHLCSSSNDRPHAAATGTTTPHAISPAGQRRTAHGCTLAPPLLLAVLTRARLEVSLSAAHQVLLHAHVRPRAGASPALDLEHRYVHTSLFASQDWYE